MPLLGKLRSLVAFLGALSFGVGSLNGSVAMADIEVGVVGPMSGQFAKYGEQMRRGAEMAVADINAAGGVKGEKLVLHVGDDACDPKQAHAVANDMAARGVNFIDGHFCSESSISASRVYEEEGILQISPASNNPKFTDEGGWNTHRICGRSDKDGYAIAGYLDDNFSGKKIGILNDGSPYGNALAAAVGNAVGWTIHERGESNVSNFISPGIDVLVVARKDYVTSEQISELRQQGLGVPIVSIGEPPDPAKFESAKEVTEKFRNSGFNPDGYTLYAYAAMQAFAQAARAVGSTEAKQISQWLRAGNTIDTVIGDLSLDSRGDVKASTLNLYIWNDATTVITVPVDQANTPETCNHEACGQGKQCCKGECKETCN